MTKTLYCVYVKAFVDPKVDCPKCEERACRYHPKRTQ